MEQKSSMTKVSIIVPVYNVEPYLNKCIDSILCQTLEDIEILLVDDGSTDLSGDICDGYAALDDRVRVIHKVNSGLSDTRNVGIDAAQGEFIGFVDGDDYIAPEMYESLYCACIEDKTGIAACDYIECTVGSDKFISRSTGQCQVMTSEAFFEEVLRYDSPVGVGVWDKLYEKSLFEKVRFQVGKLHEDTDIIYRLVFQVDRISYLSVPYYTYLSRPGSITASSYCSREYDRYTANRGMFKYIAANHPDLLDIASENRSVSNLCIVRNMTHSGIYDKEMYQRIRSENRKLLPAALKSDNIPPKTKCQLLLLCVGYRPHELFSRLYKFFKRNRIKESAAL